MKVRFNASVISLQLHNCIYYYKIYYKWEEVLNDELWLAGNMNVEAI